MENFFLPIVEDCIFMQKTNFFCLFEI